MDVVLSLTVDLQELEEVHGHGQADPIARIPGARRPVVELVGAQLTRKTAADLLRSLADELDPFEPDATRGARLELHDTVVTLEPGSERLWRYTCSCGHGCDGWTSETYAEDAAARHRADPDGDGLVTLDRPDLDLTGAAPPGEDEATRRATEHLPVGTVLDEPTAEYPLGSTCPVHQRVHNAHGWHVCLPPDAAAARQHRDTVQQ